MFFSEVCVVWNEKLLSLRQTAALRSQTQLKRPGTTTQQQKQQHPHPQQEEQRRNKMKYFSRNQIRLFATSLKRSGYKFQGVRWRNLFANNSRIQKI